MAQAKKSRQVGKHACEPCRKSKIRCFTDTLEEHGQCRRCYAQGLTCEWKEISKTRTRKRTDTRVAELEKQMLKMSAALKDMETKPTSVNGCDVSPAKSGSAQTTDSTQVQIGFASSGDDHLGVRYEMQSALSQNVQSVPSSGPHVPGSAIRFTQPLVSTQSVVDGQQDFPMHAFPAHRREKLLDTFRTLLSPAYPITWVAPQIPASELEHSRPFALNAMVTAACIISEPESFPKLHEATVTLLAKYVFVLGHRSLDLIQALLITAVWCMPPDNIANINIFQLTQAAGAMTVELGLIGRTSKQAQRQDIDQLNGPLSDQMMERVRTCLATYLTCSRNAVSYRRQIVASHRPFIMILMDAFSRNVTILEDRRLLAWLRLQNIVEDIESMKQGVEMRAEATMLENEAFRDDFELFSDRLQEWEKNTDHELKNETLKTDFYFYKSKLHELVIYFDVDTRHLELGQLVDPEEAATEIGASLNPIYVRTLLSFIDDCHSILDIILTSDAQTIRVMPILTIFRVPYAFKALAMLEKRATRPNDDMSKIVDRQTLKLIYYARSISKVLGAASESGRYAVPDTALRIRDATFRGQHFRRLAEVDELDITDETEAPKLPSQGVEALEHSVQETLLDPNQLAFPHDWPEFDFAADAWENELWISDTIMYQ